MSFNPYNPYTQKLQQLNSQLQKIEDDRRSLLSELKWYRDFDLETEHSKLMAARIEVNDARKHRDEANKLRNEYRAKLAEVEANVELGLDPRHWFSTERTIAKLVAVETRSKLEELDRELKRFDARVKTNKPAVEQSQADIDRYRAFDILSAEPTLHGLKLQSDQILERLKPLQKLSNQIDSQVCEHLKCLNEDKAHVVKLEEDILKAQELEDALSRAATGRDRAVIHKMCEYEFDESSPAQVLRGRRGKLKSVKAKIEKWENRINGIIQMVQQNIRAIIIDGNNLCYRDVSNNCRKFIGLVALEALVPELSKEYKVTLVFDPGIRNKLRIKGSEIREHFPQATVHIMPSKSKADETILAAAEYDEHTYVISNDNFTEYPEKKAVQNNRVLKHVILDHVVQVLRLDMEVKFAEM